MKPGQQTIGTYCGHEWSYKRLCDVLLSPEQDCYYWIRVRGRYTGEHFRTLDELHRFVDELPEQPDTELTT